MRTGVARAGVLGVMLVIGLGLTGCGKSKGGGAPSAPTVDAPAVSNFQIRPLTPELSGRRVEYLISATVIDGDGDVVGGRAEVQVVRTGQVISKTIEPTDLRGSSFAAVLFFESPPPGRLDLSFSVVDAAGHRSNEVAFAVTFAAAEAPAGVAPSGAGSGLRSVR